MIEAIQLETTSAVQAMERGSREVAAGVDKTTASGDALKEIIEMSAQVGDMIAQIATAATEQTSTTDEINSSVAHISDLTQTSAVGADQTAKACSDLSSLAFDLQNMVSQFKLEGQSGDGRERPRRRQGTPATPARARDNWKEPQPVDSWSGSDAVQGRPIQ